MTIPRILTGLMTLLMAATGAAVSAPTSAQAPGTCEDSVG